MTPRRTGRVLFLRLHGGGHTTMLAERITDTRHYREPGWCWVRHTEGEDLVHHTEAEIEAARHAAMSHTQGSEG